MLYPFLRKVKIQRTRHKMIVVRAAGPKRLGMSEANTLLIRAKRGVFLAKKSPMISRAISLKLLS